VNIGESFDDNNACFSYDKNWVTCGPDSSYDINQNVYDAYDGSYHKSVAAGATATVTFTGTQIALYGESNPSLPDKNFTEAHDDTTISVDGGTATNLAFNTKAKYGTISNRRMYLSPVLPYGTHTLTVTALNNNPIKLDRVKVFSGNTDLSQNITVHVLPWDAKHVSTPKVNYPKAPTIGVNRAELELVVAQARMTSMREVLKASDYTVSSWLALEDAIKYAQVLLADVNDSTELFGQAVKNITVAKVSLVPVANMNIARIDHRNDKTATEYEMNKVYYWGKIGGSVVGINYNDGHAWVNDQGTANSTYSAKNFRTKGDYYSITFTGSKIELYTTLNNANGWAEISIDGGTPEKVNFFRNRGGNGEMELAYSSPMLNEGKHTIKVVVTTESGGGSNAIVSFAYALVYNSDGAMKLETEAAKKRLLAKLDEAAAIDRTQNTQEMLDMLDAQCLIASRVVRDSNATLKQVNDALNALQEVIDLMGTAIYDLLAEAKTLLDKSIVYTPGSRLALETAIKDTEALLVNVNTTPEQLRQAVLLLKYAMQELAPLLTPTTKIDYRNDMTTNESVMNAVYYWAQNGGSKVGTAYNSGQGWVINANGGTSAYSARQYAKAGDFYSITFTGSKIELYSLLNNGNGWAEITIGEGKPEVVNLYRNWGNPAQMQMFYESPLLEPGVHTIKVKFLQKSGTKPVDQPVAGTGDPTVVSFVYAQEYNIYKSNKCNVMLVQLPENAEINGTDITANVGNEIKEQLIKVSTSISANWALYSDKECKNEITSKTMTSLVPGENTAYIKVTAENGTDTQIYKLVIIRAQPVVVAGGS
jgi:hypothetical protein